jgi:hypothetical protein
MAKPSWETASGNLGTISEGIYYSKQLVASDADGDSISYQTIAGSLPKGLFLGTTGKLQGTPTEVGDLTENKFVVRATAGTDIADRSFKIFVEGDDAPTWVTNIGNIATLYDGTYLNFQLVANDSDSDIKNYKVIEGQLPPGITLLEESGILRGVCLPVPISLFDSSQFGWDGTAWSDTQTWDQIVDKDSIDKTYQFTVRASDGARHADRIFSIGVSGSGNGLTDNGEVLASTTLVDASASDIRPLYFTTQSDLGRYIHENYYVVKIDVVDPEDAFGIANDTVISYAITSGSLPPGMKFDPTNGEVFGNITRNLSAETTYTFTIGATKTGTGYTTETYSKTFTMTVQGVGFGTLTFNAVSSELVI